MAPFFRTLNVLVSALTGHLGGTDARTAPWTRPSVAGSTANLGPPHPPRTTASVPVWRSLIDILYGRFPLLVSRVLLPLAVALRDGWFLVAFGPLALGLPAVAFAFGLWEGATRSSYGDGGIGWHTVNLNVPVVVPAVQVRPFILAAAAAGSLTSMLGVWIVAGYAAGEMLLAGPDVGAGLHVTIGAPINSTVAQFLDFRLPMLETYAALWVLIVALPDTVRLLARDLEIRISSRAGRKLRASRQATIIGRSAVVGCGLAAGAFAWTLAAPQMTRISFSWGGLEAPLAPDYVVSVLNPGLPVVVFIAAVVRGILEIVGSRRRDFVEKTVRMRATYLRAIRRGQGRRQRVKAVLRGTWFGLVFTILLAGYVNSVWQAALVFGLAVACVGLVNLVLPRSKRWFALRSFLGRQPILARVVCMAVVANLCGQAVISLPGQGVNVTHAPGDFSAEVFAVALATLGLFFALPDVDRVHASEQVAVVGANR